MKTKEQKLPKWFNGTIYKEGAVVQNRFGGGEIELNNIELSMYDFVMGASIISEFGGTVEDLRKGLDWFRKHYPKEYMVLLD